MATGPAPVFSNDGFRTTELLWKQYFQDDRVALRGGGFLDVKTYCDVYALASPWSGFANLVFSIGSNLQSVLPDRALGAMLGGYLTDNIYAVASIVDASADPTDVFAGFDTFFNDFDTFKSLDIGFKNGGKRLLTSSVQLLIDPALYETINAPKGGCDNDLIALFGVRARVQF